MDETAVERLERALDRAAREHRQRSRAAECADLAAFETGFLLARLGLFPAASGEFRRSSPSPACDDGQAARRAERLRAEAGRLARLARTGSARYDLDRHIAVRRLLAAVEPGRPPVVPSAQAVASGRVLNGRFRGPRRRPGPPLYSTKTRELAAAPVESTTEMSTKPGSAGRQEA